MSMVIAGQDCDKCRFCTLVNEDSARDIKVYCTIKDKYFRYGQCIPCDFKEKKNEENCEV